MSHYHPTISGFASTLLQQSQQLPKPDLASYTLIRFLDKFAYRNPKASVAGRGASIMQTIDAGGGTGSPWLGGRKSSHQQNDQTAVNSSNFWNRKVEEISPEDVFFHEYFKQAGKHVQGDKTRPVHAVTEAGVEEELWKALTTPARNEDPSFLDSDNGDLDSLDGTLRDMSWDGDSVLSMAEVSAEDSIGGEDLDLTGTDSDSDWGGPINTNSRPDGGVGKEGHVGGKMRKLPKGTPMFASADDYAELLGEDDF